MRTPKRILLAALSVLVLVVSGYILSINYHKIGFQGKVCLVTLGKASLAETNLMKRQIEQFYGLNVVVLPTTKLPEAAYYPPRHRYRATLILAYLADRKPRTYDKIIALTNQDISIETSTDADWGIFGLARFGGPCCVVSTFRLQKGKSTKKKFEERLTKVTLHEMGHTLGLPHCDESIYCLMNDAKGLMQIVDRAKVELCAKCLNKINYIRI